MWLAGFGAGAYVAGQLCGWLTIYVAGWLAALYN